VRCDTDVLLNPRSVRKVSSLDIAQLGAEGKLLTSPGYRNLGSWHGGSTEEEWKKKKPLELTGWVVWF